MFSATDALMRDAVSSGSCNGAVLGSALTIAFMSTSEISVGFTVRLIHGSVYFILSAALYIWQSIEGKKWIKMK